MSMTVTLDIDGPRDHEHVLEVGEAIAQSVRVANHLTMDHEAIRYPHEVDLLLRNLAAAAAGLPQLFRQLLGWLAAEQAAGRIGMHGGPFDGDPAEACMAVAHALGGAGHAAARLQELISAAASVTTDMASRVDGEEGDGNG